MLMKMRELGNSYRMKLWCLKDGDILDPTKRTVVYSDPEEKTFACLQMSQNLLVSLEIEDQDAEVDDNRVVGPPSPIQPLLEQRKRKCISTSNLESVSHSKIMKLGDSQTVNAVAR